MLLQVVLDIMKRHANHAGVVQSACGALWAMSSNAANRATVIARGGVAAARDAKRNHPGNAGVQTNADRLLAIVALLQ